MGFEVNSTNFLLYTQRGRNIDRIATLGRQSIKLLPKWYAEKHSLNIGGEYCEDLLKGALGASIVDSFDNSDYEQATFVTDMNKPVSGFEPYDLVIDFGTLEHIYNVPQALWNVSTLCKPGGEIVHVLPSNGWIGHGFYQFSPELFYSVYSEENGYSGTEVFLANCDDNKHFYRVRKPINGNRSCAESNGEAYIFVRTKRGGHIYA